MAVIRRPSLRAARGGLSPFQPRRRAGDTEVPPTPTPRRNRLSRLPVAVVRVAATALLTVGVAIVAGNVFDGFQATLLVPVVAAAAVTLAVPWLPAQVPPSARVALVVAGVVAAATAVAVLGGGTIGDAVPGMLDGPRRLLSTEWPSPPDPTVLATVALLLGAATAAAVDLARRPRLHLAPLAPVVVALVVVVGLSAPRRPAWWMLAGLALLALVMVLARHGGRAGARLATLRGERAVLVSLAVVGAAAVGTAAVVAWPGRADPRDVADANRSAVLMRSLEATVALRAAQPPLEQFVVTDESALIGQRMPTRWRVGALAEYDGQRWMPEIEVRPIGNRLAPDPPPGPDAPPTGRYRIVLRTAHTELVPLPGPPIELTGDPTPRIETDIDRVVVKLSTSAPAGTLLTLTAELAPTIGEVAPAAIVERPISDFEAEFTDAANDIVGEGETLTRLQRLEQELRSWQLDPAAPGAGQQQLLLKRFVFDTQRGTAEQFVSAFVLLARSLGFDARVATGFVVGPDEAASPLTVTSKHAAAWPEVHVADAGWLAFDPVPERQTGDEQPPDPQPEAQTPAAAQPPIDPPARPGDPDAAADEETDTADAGWGSFATWAGRAVVLIALVTLPAALALAAILAVKVVRRRRRNTAADPAERVRGAWANATDALVDAGLAIEPSWTDDRIAAMGAPLAGSAPHELRRLATMSTAATFGPAAAPTVDAVATERLVREAMAARLTPTQRLRWRLSLRSLRRATRSPVTV
ncbi:MAG TPA: transglutaminaseTgpA domain-containing protein [Ilumatobacter sp.]|nr:transglutaminaseTgpA domain-containing protein [Ilumatobacter sp.]